MLQYHSSHHSIVDSYSSLTGYCKECLYFNAPWWIEQVYPFLDVVSVVFDVDVRIYIGCDDYADTRYVTDYISLQTFFCMEMKWWHRKKILIKYRRKIVQKKNC